MGVPALFVHAHIEEELFAEEEEEEEEEEAFYICVPHPIGLIGWNICKPRRRRGILHPCSQPNRADWMEYSTQISYMFAVAVCRETSLPEGSWGIVANIPHKSTHNQCHTII